MQGKQHFFININHNMWKSLQNTLIESAKPELADLRLDEEGIEMLRKALMIPFKMPTKAEFNSFDKNHDGRVSKREWMSNCN